MSGYQLMKTYLVNEKKNEDIFRIIHFWMDATCQACFTLQRDVRNQPHLSCLFCLLRFLTNKSFWESFGEYFKYWGHCTGPVSCDFVTSLVLHKNRCEKFRFCMLVYQKLKLFWKRYKCTLYSFSITEEWSLVYCSWLITMLWRVCVELCGVTYNLVCLVHVRGQS